MLELYFIALDRYFVMFIVPQDLFSLQQVITDKVEYAHFFF